MTSQGPGKSSADSSRISLQSEGLYLATLSTEKTSQSCALKTLPTDPDPE
jgi:hypothetical protein